jgi:cell division septation protein DedD
MTQNARIKRLIAGLLLISMLTGCGLWNSWFGREEVNVGEYVTLRADSTLVESSVAWVFTQLPDTSRIQGFLPSDSALTISFIPDAPGKYEVTLQQSVGEETDETTYYFTAVMLEDTTLLNVVIPDHLAVSLQVEDTTITDTQSVASFTEQGDQRRYLGKIVDPNKAKVSRRSSSPARKSAVKSRPQTVSRGNLIPVAAKTFTIQVSSWPSLEEAQVASRELLDDYGIESYIQRAFFKDKDEIFYRLRVGNFKEQSQAETYAKEIHAQTNLPVWVDYIRKEM